MTKKLLVLALSAALAACGGSENQAPIFESETQFQLDEDTSFSGQLRATDAQRII